MPRSPLSSLTHFWLVCFLLATAAAANRVVPRLSTASLSPVAIETFPRSLAGWTCLQEQNADTPVLPAAHAIDRVYQDSAGRRLHLLLLTSRDYEDFHDPNTCLPLQGFTLGPLRQLRLPGTDQDAFLLTATRRSESLQMLYWWPGHQTLHSQYGRVEWGKALALRDRLAGEPGHSLFVRMICPADADSVARLTQTGAAFQPALAALCRQTTPPPAPTQ
jgi:hypothetical protein